MKTIILDTNILLQDKVDIMSELRRICDFSYETAILDRSLKELEKKKGEKIAREILAKKDIKVIKTNKDQIVDKTLLEKAPEEKWIIVTQDKALKQELVKKGVSVITIRQQKTLAFVNNNVL